MKKASGILLAGLGMVAVSQVRADILADWTFETSAPSVTGAAAGPFSPELGLETATASASGLHASSATVYSSPAGNGSTHSFSANTWANGDYYQVKVNTVGYQNITLSFDQTSSNTGPGQYQLQWSTDGTTFNNFGSTYTVLANATPNAWSASTPVPAATFSLDLSSVTQINGQSTVFLRFEDESTTSANGGTVAAAGTDRMDNIIVSATVVPEPSTLALLTLGGLSGVGFAFRRKK